MTGIAKCHIRALHNLSEEAALDAWKKKVGYKSGDMVKKILRAHFDTREGNVFRMSQSLDQLDHWVAISKDSYFDDNAYFRVKSFSKACAILELCDCRRQSDVVSQFYKPRLTRRLSLAMKEPVEEVYEREGDVTQVRAVKAHKATTSQKDTRSTNDSRRGDEGKKQWQQWRRQL